MKNHIIYVFNQTVSHLAQRELIKRGCIAFCGGYNYAVEQYGSNTGISVRKDGSLACGSRSFYDDECLFRSWITFDLTKQPITEWLAFLDTPEPEPKSLGQVGFEAWNPGSGITWGDITTSAQTAWKCAAQAIISEDQSRHAS